MTEMAPEQAKVADLSHTPVRDFTLRSAFALAFSDVSPIVGIYSVFAICLIAAGPAFFWGFVVVLIGQLAVTGVFGDLVSKWPFQGCVYQWARELFGARYGWFTNWAFSWGLVIAMGAVALFAAEFLGPAMGLNSLTQTETSLLALGILLFGTFANMIGRRFLRGLLYVSMTAELIASLGIGIALLFFHRTHPFSFLFSGAGTAHGSAWLFGPFLAIVAFIGFSFVGFESAGSIAEEVKGARHVLPKAISLALLSVGLLVMFATLGLILALPDLGAVLSGKDTNPIATTLEARLGGGTGRALLVMLTIGFTASMIAVQASVSRAIWASARASELPLHRVLSRLSGPDRLPRHVIGLTCIVAGILVFIHNANVFTLLLSGATAGFFVSYALPVVGAAITRLRGGWSPGPVSMGKAAATVTYFAAIWMVVEIINIAWPRNTYGGVWYLNWGIILAIAVLGVIGVIVSTYVFRPGSDASSARFEPVVTDPEGE
jgi:amino acid transporter